MLLSLCACSLQHLSGRAYLRKKQVKLNEKIFRQNEGGDSKSAWDLP